MSKYLSEYQCEYCFASLRPGEVCGCAAAQSDLAEIKARYPTNKIGRLYYDFLRIQKENIQRNDKIAALEKELAGGREEMSNEEMIVALNTVVEALGRHDLEIILADNKRLREENERLKKESYANVVKLLTNVHDALTEREKQAKEEIISLSKVVQEKNAEIERLREENERLKKENGTLRKTIADWEMIDAKAKEEGAREMLAWIVDNHWALGGMADSQEKTMQLWRAGRGRQ